MCILDEFPVGKSRHISNGLPGIERRMSLAFSARKLELTRFVEVISTNTAKALRPIRTERRDTTRSVGSRLGGVVSGGQAGRVPLDERSPASRRGSHAVRGPHVPQMTAILHSEEKGNMGPR
ncbi:hypothetical protein F5X98DRAFT_193209 [Xylaria grammica]|nr:hypothetical protein F5X98DRAFT_193209 [Xylaria grammica]